MHHWRGPFDEGSGSPSSGWGAPCPVARMLLLMAQGAFSSESLSANGRYLNLNGHKMKSSCQEQGAANVLPQVRTAPCCYSCTMVLEDQAEASLPLRTLPC